VTNGGTGQSRDEAYQAWFDRMRNKRASAPSPAPDPSAGNAPNAAGGYWSTDNLFRDSELQAERDSEERARRGEIASLLARLGLGPDASWADVNAAYKRLAKEHHPDRNIDKTTRTSQHHLEEMMELNRVHRTLRSLMAGS